jgi:hypothetical protein
MNRYAKNIASRCSIMSSTARSADRVRFPVEPLSGKD